MKRSKMMSFVRHSAEYSNEAIIIPSKLIFFLLKKNKGLKYSFSGLRRS